jgi:hypothetical protein
MTKQKLWGFRVPKVTHDGQPLDGKRRAGCLLDTIKSGSLGTRCPTAQEKEGCGAGCAEQ